jgi:hypothetical protein
VREFTLHVIPSPEGHYGVEVRQHLNGAGGRREVPVVRAWGAPFQAGVQVVLDALRRSGYRPSELHRGRRTPFVLREEWGVRTALLLLALKPLRKTSRMERIAQAIAAMTEEECYYWFSKCVGDGRQAQRALRVLVAG